MVAGPVDRFDPQQTLAAETVRRETPFLHRAGHMHVVGCVGDTDNLKLMTALVTPESGKAVVGLRAADDARRNALCLIDRILH